MSNDLRKKLEDYDVKAFENHSKSLISQDRPTFRSVYKTITNCTHCSK